jgi:hypothetical protein
MRHHGPRAAEEFLKQINPFEPDAWHRLGLPPSPLPPMGSEPCFIRFGHAPPDGFSYNHFHGEGEPGVAVFKGVRTYAGQYLIDLQERAALAIIYVRTRSVDRPAYLVNGRVVGHGIGG